jgi:hypothetical protein
MQTTKFKVGDVVYDSVNYPNQKGIVNEISLFYGELYPIHVNFNNNSHNWYTINGCLSHNGTSISTLSFTPYEVEFKGFTQDRPKVLTDEMKVCIKGDGTAEYGKKIIEYLEKLGGINNGDLNGINNGELNRINNIFYYLIDEDFDINIFLSIPQGYREIDLKKELREFNDYIYTGQKQGPICYVGKKIEYNGSIFLILQQDKESVDILLDGKQEVIMIEDIKNGKYRIIE